MNPDLVQTNILFAAADGIDASKLSAALRERGVLTSGVHGRLRFVTHHGIERDDIEFALQTAREVVASLV